MKCLPTFFHKDQLNVGKYAIHGSYGLQLERVDRLIF